MGDAVQVASATSYLQNIFEIDREILEFRKLTVNFHE
jgi:hypothetical protein